MIKLFLATTNNPLINGKNRDLFAAEVLNFLRKSKISFRKCPPDFVTIYLDGRVKVWFYGYRDGKPWRGGVGFNCVRPDDRVYMTDPAIVAEMCAKHIALMNAD